MKKVLLSAMVAIVAGVMPAAAADLGKMYTKAPVAPAIPVWDIAFGGGIASDYNFRGISQSDRGPSPFAYFEPRYNISPNLQLYVGVASYGVELPSNPSAEVDIYAGIRPTFGAFAFDFGLLYYYYPTENQLLPAQAPNGVSATLRDTDFLEFYAKVTYTFSDVFSVGAAVYYADDYLNSGAEGTYGSLNAKYVLPTFANGIGWFVSGELSHYWLGTPSFDVIAFNPPVNLPDYTTWNVGVGFTYKALTLDLRYYDTDLSREECFFLTQDPNAPAGGTAIPGNGGGNRTNWCSDSFVAKLSFDTTLTALK